MPFLFFSVLEISRTPLMPQGATGNALAWVAIILNRSIVICRRQFCFQFGSQHRMQIEEMTMYSMVNLCPKKKNNRQFDGRGGSLTAMRRQTA